MGADAEIQGHLDLSREWLEAAETLLVKGLLAPAYHDAVHALELALKAALTSLEVKVPKEHNIAGAFGLHFRDRFDAADLRRINRILRSYNGPRYPDWEAPAHTEIEGDVAFIGQLVRQEIPRLVKEGRP
ncbi:MAG: hypothetical protein QOE90_1640 [Thermoplasmata archaeon]|jgi:HEPN domain-containing protein|nr:hypothetical protein [Thermoplasmata archaeon]